MALIWRGWIVALLVINPMAVVAQTIDSTRHSSLVVRIFDRFGVSSEQLRAAQADATQILGEAGIELSWLHCWEGDKEPAENSARCRQPLGRNEVILRIQSGNTSAGNPVVSMGFSLVDSRNGPANLSTVYADQVASIAQHAGVDSTTLLGRAIAHEIGHLLLDTNQHTKSGLMRALWSQTELRRNRAADWSFQEGEAVAMRASAASRGNPGS